MPLQRGPRGPRGEAGPTGDQGPAGIGAVTRANFTATAAQSVFTLPVTVPNSLRDGCVVFRQGQACERNTTPTTVSEYEISGTTLTFGAGLSEGERVNTVLWYTP